MTALTGAILVTGIALTALLFALGVAGSLVYNFLARLAGVTEGRGR